MFVAVLFLALTATVASANTIGFVSDMTWEVYQGEAGLIGNAQTVCLNASDPPTCPAGATVYGFPGGWGADLSAIPGAAWIWAPGVNGSTSPIELVGYSFIKSFMLNGMPLGGSIMISADDFAQIFVNGHLVGTVGSLTDMILADQKVSLTSFDISDSLQSGLNTIEIFGQNGIGAFGECEGCSYSQHPAGLVFGGSFSFAPTEVPEPSTMSLFGVGIALFAIARYRYAKR